MKRFIIATTIFGIILSITAAIAVCYFAENDRKILLLVIYPAIGFIAIGFSAWIEKKFGE